MSVAQSVRTAKCTTAKCPTAKSPTAKSPGTKIWQPGYAQLLLDTYLGVITLTLTSLRPELPHGTSIGTSEIMFSSTYATHGFRVSKIHSCQGKLVSGANCFWGQIGLGGEFFWRGLFFGRRFVKGRICPRRNFDGWLIAQWLLSGGCLLWAFDRIPQKRYVEYIQS